MKLNTIVALLALGLLNTGCCALSTVVGPTTRIHGQVQDQNGTPVPYCPLSGHWEHGLSKVVYMWSYYGHQTLLLSDRNGNWEFSRRGVDRLFVQVGKDSNQRLFPGYTFGHNWCVGGHPDEIEPSKQYIIGALVNTNLITKPYTPSSEDTMGERYKMLRESAGLQ